MKETEEALDQSKRQLADANQEFVRAKEALTKAGGEIASVETELSEVTSALEGEKKTTELTDALEIARAHAKKVLERGLGSETAGGNVFDQFLASIDAETAGKADAEKTKWEQARALLSQRRPDNRTELVDRLIDKTDGQTTEGKPNSKEVFDHLIALLRHEYIQEVKKSGKEGGQAPQIEAALKSAWDLRTSFVYIRPAGAYLRSSYPTPSLQDDPSLAWNNMLTQTTFRGMPVTGKYLSELCLPRLLDPFKFNPCEFEKKEKLVAEIDKRFWQNVNKVRVTGGGRTNYVVAKDDIGNWSVKEVATDPEDIIKGAKSLALFGLGSSSGLPLLTKSAQPQSAGSSGGGEVSASGQQSKTQLQNVYEKYQTEYEQAAATAIEDLKKDLGTEGMSHQIQILWEGNQSLEPHVKQLKTLLTEARKGLDEALKLFKADSDATKADRPSHILSGVKAIYRFHNELRDGIKMLQLPAKPAAALVVAESERSSAETAVQEAMRNAQDRSGPEARLKEAARVVENRHKDLELAKSMEVSALQAVANVCHESLTRWIKRRQEANKSYETSILFIGEVTKPKGQ
jgi:hypothetical protein